MKYYLFFIIINYKLYIFINIIKIRGKKKIFSFLFNQKNKYRKDNELLKEKNKQLFEEIEKYRKENEKYIIQLKGEALKIETLKKENNDFVNKNKSLENERNNYRNLNENLNNQINYKTSEVRLCIIIIIKSS